LADRRAPGYLDRLVSTTTRAAHDVAGGLRGGAARSVRTRTQIRWGVPGGLEVEAAPLPEDPSGPAPRRAMPAQSRPVAPQWHGRAPAPEREAALPDGANAATPTPSLVSHDEHRAARPLPAPTAQPRIDRVAVHESQVIETPLRSPTDSPTVSPVRSAVRRDEATPHAPTQATHPQAWPADRPAEVARDHMGVTRARHRPTEGDVPHAPRPALPVVVPLRPREPRPAPSPAPGAIRSAPPQLHIGTIEVTIAAPTPPPPVQVAPIQQAHAPAVRAHSAPQPAERISRPLATYGLGQW
jgi:hypothetical protein